MAESKRLTQTAIIRELAEATGVNNRVSKQYLESLADLAVRETKKNGIFILPGIGASCAPIVRRGLAAIRQPAKRSRFRPRSREIPHCESGKGRDRPTRKRPSNFRFPLNQKPRDVTRGVFAFSRGKV